MSSFKNFFKATAGIFLVCFIWFFIISWMILAEFLSFASCFLIPLKKRKKSCFKKGLVSVTIANWNSKAFILDCLKSITNQEYPAIEIIIVDNNSSDNSLLVIEEFVSKNKLDVKIIRNNKNEGFAKAHNQAIAECEGEFILVLNFDVVLSEKFIKNMVKEMHMDKSIGFLSGKIFSNEVRNCRRVIDTTGVELRNLFCCDRGQAEVDKGQFEKREYIFGVSGCASFYRRDMIDDIMFGKEYFDEIFNTYVEDVDLSWRAQSLGWRCLYVPMAVAFHDRGVTRKGLSYAKKRIYKKYFIQGFRNRYLMILKNLPFLILIKRFGCIMRGEFKFWMSVFFTKRYFYTGFLMGFILLSPFMIFRRLHVIKSSGRYAKEVDSILRWPVK